MTARVSAAVTMASCIAPFARSNVAPMLQEKELSDPRHPVVAAAVAVPPRRKRARANRKEMQCHGRILVMVIVISPLPLA
jgi:hypothetical protein